VVWLEKSHKKTANSMMKLAAFELRSNYVLSGVFCTVGSWYEERYSHST